MNPEPFAFQCRISDFDLAQLPIDSSVLRENPQLLRSAVESFYQDCFRKLGGSASILVRDDIVSVTWYPKEGDAAEQVFDQAVKLLQQGDYKSAEPLLRALLARNPNHPNALLNLGMMLSDQKRLLEASSLLARFVELRPDSSPGWTALGVAHIRKGDDQAALSAFERALEINPEDAYATRNLGALLGKQSPEKALPFLERAARMMPTDQPAQFGYAQCLLRLGRTKDADSVFVKTIELNPLTSIAEQARTARTAISHQSLRSAVGGGTRPDAVMYCLDGLQKFRELGDAKTRSIIFEIAMLGRNGLDINDPAKKYSLRSLPGAFSGLHLVSLMYTGTQLVAPGTDTGIDLSQEFAEARSMFEQSEGN